MALDGLGHHVSHTVVAELLHALGYSLQGNIKTREGRQHGDRDAQCRYMARRVRAAQRAGQPAISVDTKKKELVGNFKNAGRTWRPGRSGLRVRSELDRGQYPSGVAVTDAQLATVAHHGCSSFPRARR